MKYNNYKEQLKLILLTLDSVLRGSKFALKGGTAINLFYRDLPRYSVDIDLCYLDLEDRATTIKNIHELLEKISSRLKINHSLNVKPSKHFDGKSEVRLIVSNSDTEIKIDTNYILRGHLFPTKSLPVCQKVQEEFGTVIDARCLSFADCYGGKICAALDRQHPRDLFDIKLLLEKEGVTEDIKDSFIFYLLSHNRPINELLKPNLIEINTTVFKEFQLMAREEVKLSDLVEARSTLITQVMRLLTSNDHKFIISFVRNKPDWNLLRYSHIKDFPAVKWKLLNQQKMSSTKRERYIAAVDKLFFC